MRMYFSAGLSFKGYNDTPHSGQDDHKPLLTGLPHCHLLYLAVISCKWQKNEGHDFRTMGIGWSQYLGNTLEPSWSPDPPWG